MENKIILSIIIPVFNSEQFLSFGLQCLKKQTAKCVEFIVINDGSTDGSEKIILDFIKEDYRFRYIPKASNSGYGDTCNMGIKNSKGQYIAIFEPDDLIPDDFYECLLNQTKTLQADIIKYNGIYKFDDCKISRLFQLRDFPETIFQKNDYPRFWRAHPCIVNGIYKKEFIIKNNIQFVTGAGASYQDTQFSVSLYYANPTIVIIDECKYQYRQHPVQSVSQQDPKIINIVINNWIDFFNKHGKHIRKKDYWFANIQMYRQFNSLNKRFLHNRNSLNIFYSYHIKKTGMPNWKNLAWFHFNYWEMIKFYWFILRKSHTRNYK